MADDICFISKYELNTLWPTYAIEKWNCHSRVLKHEPWTNNLLMGFNNAFCRLLNQAHPSIYKLIEAMRKYYQLATGHMVKFLGGERKFKGFLRSLEASFDLTSLE